MVLAQHITYATLLLLLILATITDLRERIIPDKVILLGTIVVLAVHLIFRIRPLWTYFLAGFGVLVLLLIMAVITGGRVIGGGDIKLFALIAFTVGFFAFIHIFVISHVVAAIFLVIVKLFRLKQWKLKDEIAFAPFMLLGTGVTYGLLLL